MHILELEAFVYWTAALNFRLKSSLGGDVGHHADDLAVIASYTQNAVIHRDCLRLLGIPLVEDNRLVAQEKGKGTRE